MPVGSCLQLFTNCKITAFCLLKLTFMSFDPKTFHPKIYYGIVESFCKVWEQAKWVALQWQRGRPEKEPAPLSWRFCPLLCWLKALPTRPLLPEGECFGMVQNVHQAVRYYIVPYDDELTEGPLPPSASLRVNKSPPLASHIFNQSSCSHSHALSNNNKHFNAGLLLMLLCVHFGDKLCLMRQRKWDRIKLRPVVPGWGQ